MKTRFFFSLLFFLFVITACDNGFSSAGIPETYTIEFNKHGGMAPYSTTIHFSNKDSSHVSFLIGEAKNKITFLPTQKELEGLVKNIRKQRFNKIESKEEEVMDRGGKAIQINFDGKKYKASDMGISFLKDKWRPNFTALEEHIIAIAKQNVSKQLIPITIELDESMKEENTIISLEANNNTFITWTTSAGNQVLRPEYRTRMMPGDNSLSCNIFRTGSANNAHLVSWRAAVSFQKGNKRIKLSRVENEIVYEID